jgi:hypothetical protein
MNLENSGKIYKFLLDFDKGYAYAEILDYSDVSGFSGILIQVFNYIGEKDDSSAISEVKKSGIMFGPAPVNKYPNTKGKGAWKLYGKDENFNTVPPSFKFLRGLLVNNNWADLGPWFIQDWFGDNKTDGIESNYEEVRNLETMILNHPDSIKVKITMMKIIEAGERVADYYDLEDLGNKNLYLQVVNTYYDKDTTELLLSYPG